MKENVLNHIFNVSEIFYSIQGEGTRTGIPCVFVRLQGCRLRCVWCDTPYALQFTKKELEMSGAEIIEKVKSFGVKFIEFTGGEPLEQPEIAGIMHALCEEGFTVAVETAGYIDTEILDPRVVKIIDVKCPGSKMVKMNNYKNLEIAGKNDEIKFVIGTREDYEFAKKITEDYNLSGKCGAVLFSPVFRSNYEKLVDWILEDKLNVRLQLQIHKFIWHPDKRGV